MYRVRLFKRPLSRKFSHARYPGFRYVANRSLPRGYCFEGTARTEEELRSLRERAAEDRFRLRAVDVAFLRSRDYRKRFFEANPGPYRCRYCNRRLDRAEVTVDHLVPVAKTAESLLARKALGALGASGANDLENLAPSCRRCNSRKGAKVGLWTVRGVLGAYRAYWAVVYALAALAVCCAIVLIAAGALAVGGWAQLSR